MIFSSSAKSGIFTVSSHVLDVHQYALSHLSNKSQVLDLCQEKLVSDRVWRSFYLICLSQTA